MIYGSWVLGSLNRPMSQDCSMIESYSLSNSGSVVKFEVLFDIWLGGRVHGLGLGDENQVDNYCRGRQYEVPVCGSSDEGKMLLLIFDRLLYLINLL